MTGTFAMAIRVSFLRRYQYSRYIQTKYSAWEGAAVLLITTRNRLAFQNPILIVIVVTLLES